MLGASNPLKIYYFFREKTLDKHGIMCYNIDTEKEKEIKKMRFIGYKVDGKFYGTRLQDRKKAEEASKKFGKPIVLVTYKI